MKPQTRPLRSPASIHGISDPGDFYSSNLLHNYPSAALYLPNLVPELQSMKANADRGEYLSNAVREALSLNAQKAGSFDPDASQLANGALGGKLIGAGGGGFLMFYAEDKARLRDAMRERGLTEVRFRFEPEGTKILIQ